MLAKPVPVIYSAWINSSLSLKAHINPPNLLILVINFQTLLLSKTCSIPRNMIRVPSGMIYIQNKETNKNQKSLLGFIGSAWRTGSANCTLDLINYFNATWCSHLGESESRNSPEPDLHFATDGERLFN